MCCVLSLGVLWKVIQTYIESVMDIIRCYSIVATPFLSTTKMQGRRICYGPLCGSMPLRDRKEVAGLGLTFLVRRGWEVSKDNVGYLPTIDAPATNMTTVHQVLVQSLWIKDTLKLQSIDIVFDQATYAKAPKVQWKQSDKLKDIILQMGVFHTTCTLLSVIGKRFQDYGLRDLCIKLGVIAEKSVSGVLEGWRYNRVMSFHKLMYEGLMRLVWSGLLT